MRKSSEVTCWEGRVHGMCTACARRVHGLHLELLRGEVSQGPQGGGGF